MKHRTRRIAKRWLAMVLCLCMIFPSAGTFASAAEKSAYTGGLCEHHPEHTPECGYTEAVEGQPCAHVHDESCGYSEPTEEIPCTHSHDESCGYQAAVAEIPCDKGCTNTDENGNIIHQEGCAYQPAVEEQPCTHEHDETCGYQTAVEGSPCTHIHDEGCGYVEAVEEQPCSFICEICSKEQDVNPQQDDGNLFPGYVSKLVVSGMTDGTAPFDSDDTAGNDSSGNNQIVRSYDNIRYDLTASFAARTAEATASSAKLWYEMTLNTDVLAATYDTSQMKWLQNNYTIEYLDQNGNTLYSRDGDEGAYYIWESGAKTDRALNSLNDIAKGSTAGTESYTTAIASQRLTGWTMVTGSSDNANVLSGTKTFSAGVQVLNAEQGTKFQPTFKVWLDGNEENKGAIDDGGDGSPVLENIVTADVVTASADARYNVEFKKNSDLNYRSWFDFFTGDELTGSSTVSYSINGKTLTGADIYRLLEALSALEENHGKSDPSKYTANAGTIDESLLCGLALADYKEVFSNIRYGRMTGYGLTLQLYNAADDTDNLSAKGLRGMNLPVGDVTFDLNLKLTATNDNNQPFDEDGNYTILLWDYNRNIPSNVDYGTRTVDDHSVTIYKGDTGWDRNMYWNGESRSPYARGCGPYNYQFATSSSTVNKSYWGGDWGMTWSGSGGAASSSESDGMIPGDVTGDGSSASYHFRVSGFDFDFSDLAGMNFPTNRAGSSLIQSGWNSYIGCFSAGYIQTLNVFPRYQTQTVNLASELKVDNFSAQTRAGDAIINETLLTDNALTDKIELYASGSLAKGNSFTKLGSQSMSTNYLGTDYWLTSYDCSVYAGDTVALLGYGLLSATSDYRIRAMNLLQLFDSRVLSVAADDTTYTADGGPYSALDLSNGGNPGTTTILYAADPDHKGGYDTVDGCDGLSGNEVMQYMNEVREEDLVYYTSLEALENDGYTCIGVLMELRDCDLSAGTYQHLTVPVRINGDDPALINQTAGTVNTVRVWCGEGQMSGVSWADGAWDSETEKNTLDGYVEITGSAGADGYSAKVENTKYYEKTRYENGKWAGGHTNGTPYGNTLLILGYKAGVDITVDKELAGTTYNYDLDKGEYEVSYRLTGIHTTTEDSTVSETQQNTTTSLTILSALDEGYEGDQRIAVTAGSYCMESGNGMVLTDGQGNILYETDEDGNTVVDENNKPVYRKIPIGTGESGTTTVHYAVFDGNGNIEKDEDGNPVVYTITVYGEPSADRKQVTFHLDGVTVGKYVPNITYTAQLQPNAVHNNDTIAAYAYISGSGDCRAYSETHGNMGSVNISLIQLTSTRLVKSVDTDYIELDGTFTYTVTYTNSGNDYVKFFMNDLLPATGDTRSSQYTGTLEFEDIYAYLNTVEEEANPDYKATVFLYFSTTDYQTLLPLLDLNDEEKRDTDKIQDLLEQSGHFKRLGSISSGEQEVTYDQEYQDYLQSDARKPVTAIYVYVGYNDNGLRPNRSLNLDITVKAKGNQASDIYQNTAHSWLGDESEPLVSNQVQTVAISRAISGVVWYDADMDGIRDKEESLIPGVTCTLFCWDENTDQYVPCTEDVTGAKIDPVVTGSDGSYTFPKLAAGNYIVAFSGTALDNYIGATSYQKEGADGEYGNDGVALAKTDSKFDKDEISSQYPGIDSSAYPYAIAYTLGGDGTANPVALHTIQQIKDDNITLDNYVERYDHQDLGLVNHFTLSGSKTWEDKDDQDGKRPASIIIRLYANGTELKDRAQTVKPDENGEWKWEFTDLPKYSADGNKITYTITEDAVDGYTPSYNGMNVTNSYTPEKTSVTVTKAWDDAGNQDGIRPASITVKLLADGADTGKTVILSEGNNWTDTFTGLDKYKGGKEIAYSIEEVSVTGYDTVITGTAATGFTVTNSYIPETVDLSGSKTWNDNDNQDGKRPASITIRLYADGKELADQAQTVKPDQDGNWKWSFTELPKYANGKTISYTITEDVVDGYTPSYNGMNVTNSYTPEKTSVTVTKAWNDAGNQDGIRPASIAVKLLADGADTGKTVILSEGNNWTDTFTGLDKYKGGKEIVYTIEEVSVTGYDTVISGTAATGFTVTNSHTPETTEVSGSKTWDDADNQDGKRPESITIRLLANGQEKASKTVTAENDWKWSFTNLPKYENGQVINYTITEDTVTDYTTTVNGFDVTNSYTPGKTSVTVTKVWNDKNDQDGIRPESITVKLLADGADTEKTAVLSEGNNWTDTFTGLDEYKDGEKIVYTIKEVSVEGYESVITGDVATGFIITNSHTPATTEVSGSKTWDDADNQDGKRPESITIRLLANGQEKDSKTVTAENGWKWSFTNLPKYENGQVISYTITEDTVTDYTTTVNGYDVTNSYTPGKTSVTVTKTWSDAGNQDGIRPAEVIVELLANGEPTGKTLTLSTETRWMGIFTELDEYKGGEKIVYSVKEISVEGYESVISGDAATGFIITNSHTPETIVFSGSKTWDDADNQDGKRPQSITIRLYANGKEMEVVTVTAENGWAWEFNELPKYENGNEIRYTITEEAVDGYQSEIDGMNVTNHYTPGKINIPVTKNWQDKDDADGIRPDSITVKLYADGTDTGRELILDQEHNWTGSFDDLDEYADGVKIVYTIAEVKVEGYDTSISGSMETGFVITNSHTPYIPEQPSKPEQPKENGDTPKTGDTTNLALWLGLLAISGTGLTAALLLGKKKRHHSKHMK